MDIKLYPHPVLRKKTGLAEKKDVDNLYPRLITAMVNNGGIGLACNQVGIDKSIAIISETVSSELKKPLLLINPLIIESGGTQSMDEACLSVKGVSCRIKRFNEIKVETGLPGKRKVIFASGLLSTVIQHEIDHLNGILFPDRASLISKCLLLYRARKAKKKSE